MEANIKKKMQNISARFLEIYKQYFKGNSNDKELSDVATQPFWQSMRLSKRRLDEKGLKMDIELVKEANHQKTPNEILLLERDGSDFVGNMMREVVTRRHYIKDNKKIYSRKESEIYNLNMLQADVQGEDAACPNCGRVDKISAYIDGCDACGAIFSVKDFETKVSAFSLEENAWKRIKRTIKSTIITLGSITVALGVAGILFVSILFAFLMTGNNGMSAVASAIIFMFATDAAGVGIHCVVSLFLLYGVFYWIYSAIYRARFYATDVVHQELPGFSVENFCQELEYKLRNIHMTENANEVSGFARCSLTDVVNRYGDVVDCSVNRVRFLKLEATNDGYLMDVEVMMRLFCYNGKRIKCRYEKIHLTMLGRTGVIKRKTRALREYKCKNCAASINILEGSTCRYCESVFDYADYGWVIEKYKIKKKFINIHKITRIGLVVLYVLVFVLQIFGVSNRKETDSDSWKSLLEEVRESDMKVRAIYEEVPMPEELDGDIQLIDSSYTMLTYSKVYKVENEEDVMIQYIQLLADRGYGRNKDGVDDVVEFSRKIEILDEVGMLNIYVTAEDDTIKVFMGVEEIK